MKRKLRKFSVMYAAGAISKEEITGQLPKLEVSRYARPV